MRTVLLCLGAVYVFGNFYLMVEQKEALRRDGQTVYLALAPRDPRSLLQGDYMALNYEVTNEMNHLQLDPSSSRVPISGVLVISLDDRNAGHFVRIHQGESLAPREHLLKFHHQDWYVVIGAEKYFIPEGSGSAFEKAVFGELKVAPDGTPILVALCDKDLRPISAPVTDSSHGNE
jgi:uncharacterized membrane-anchored protein